MTRPLNPLEDWLTQPGGLADKLRAARLAARLTGARLAAANNWPTSKISKIEGGKQTPTAADIEAWLQTCGASENDVRDALAQLEQIRSQYRDWRRRMRAGQVPVQAGYNEIVRDAAMVRMFETAIVPGLLQTAAYARAVLAEMVKLHGAPDDVDAAVATRMQRQQYLYDQEKRLEFLVCEPVLRWLVCPPEVMLGQLDRLHAVAAGLPSIRFGILPLGVQLSTTPQNAFSIYVGGPAGDVALVETFTGETTHTGDEAARYGQIMDSLWEDAVEGEDARRLISEAAEAVRQLL